MAAASIVCLYVIALTSCCISVFNHFRYESLKETNNLQNSYRYDKNNGGAHSRERRDSHAPTIIPKEMKTLFSNLGELTVFIREEMNRSVHALLDDILEDRLKQTLEKKIKCECPGKKGERGHRGHRGKTGMRGPPGKQGERGLGLFSPAVKDKAIFVTTNASESKVMSCKFFGNPIPNTYWASNASDTVVKTEVDKEKSEVTTILQIRNISWEDRGIVSCFATSILGKVKESGYLTVHAPPIISLQSDPFFATLRSTVTFPECKVVSNPSAKITWKRGFRIFPAIRTYINGGILQISDVKVEDEGYYECLATNYLGTARRLIQLRTKELGFSKKPANIVRANGTSVTLTCAALGSPEGMFGKWSMSGKVNVLYSTDRRRNEFAISIRANTSGKFKCEISDNVTKIESYVEVKMFKLVNSAIMNSTQMLGTLGTWISNNAFGVYKLCWSGRRHGFSVTTFYNKCTGKANTITIFKSTNSEIYGGFTDIPWRQDLSRRERVYHSTRYTYSSESFVFTFRRKPTKVPVYKIRNAVCDAVNCGPCFGELEVYYQSNTGYSSIGKSYKSTSISSLASTNTVDDVEVFYLT